MLSWQALEDYINIDGEFYFVCSSHLYDPDKGIPNNGHDDDCPHEALRPSFGGQ